MALILTARYVSHGLGQFSYREPPEATDSCPKKLTRERPAVPHRITVQRSLRYRLAEESA